MQISTAPTPMYAWPNEFRRRRSAATAPATWTNPRVRRRRRAGAWWAPGVTSRRRVSIRVVVKTYASFIAWTLVQTGTPTPEAPSARPDLPSTWGGVVPGGRRGEPDARTYGVGGMESDLFRHPQPRRAGAGVGLHLRLRGADGSAGDSTEGSPVAAGTDRLLGWADAVCGLDVEE